MDTLVEIFWRVIGNEKATGVIAGLIVGGLSMAWNWIKSNKLTKEQIADLCVYLCDTVRVHAVTAQWFPSDWVAAAQQACETTQDGEFISGDGLAEGSVSLGGAAGVALFPSSIEDLTRAVLSLSQARESGRRLRSGPVGTSRPSTSPHGASYPKALHFTSPNGAETTGGCGNSTASRYSSIRANPGRGMHMS